jgi:DNA-binding IclR family transcriptional regulator
MRIQSLDRAIRILDLFRGSRDPLGISEMAAALDLAKTTVHGLVSTLEKNGFLLKDAGTRKYRLGFALFELGSIQVADLEINQRAFLPLRQLANLTNEICRVGIWDRRSIIITMTVQPQGHESTTRQIGPRLPIYCTALGKAILANMPEAEIKAYLDETDLIAYTPNTITDRQVLEKDLAQTRERGYSISRREILLHQVGLGAPVLNAAGGVIASVSVRLNAEDLETYLVTTSANHLMRTAHQISMDIGYQPMDMQSRQLS